MEKDIFSDLYSVDVNDHVSTKDTGRTSLKYLSWSWAWAEVRKRYPDATYEIMKNENGLPYFYDPQAGIMVYTSVTINGETHTMWLPVMDGANNSMKFEPYEMTTKYGSKPVAAARMTDINNTLMRCLTKNLAIFGLGLYIYSGEDIPEESEDVKAAKKQAEEELNTIKAEIGEELKRIGAAMSDEEKKTLWAKTVTPIAGANYKVCQDKDKLTKLLEKLKKVK